MKVIYIDAQNTHRKTIDYGRIIDWNKFFIYLTEKYNPDIIYYAIWFIDRFEKLYKYLDNIWYKLLFKETIVLPNWEIKGNVDIDIAIRSILDICRNNLQKAYILSNDWDYNTLIRTLIEEWKFGWLIVPDIKTASKLIKKFNKTILNLQDIKNKIIKI